MNYNNKTYGVNKKGNSKGKDIQAHYFHKNRDKKHDAVVNRWLKETGNKL